MTLPPLTDEQEQALKQVCARHLRETLWTTTEDGRQLVSGETRRVVEARRAVCTLITEGDASV